MQNNLKFWKIPKKDLFSEFDTSEAGLTQSSVEERLKIYGQNEVERMIRKWHHILFSQFTNSLILVLIGAGILSLFFGDVTDSIVIFIIVALNGILGFFQEYKSEQALEKLRKFISLHAKVIRNGKKIEVDAKNLVPGDIVSLEIGDKVPADIRLIRAEELSIDESVLTGESYPVEKTALEIKKDNPIPQEMLNTAFMGTIVSSGNGLGVVVRTGNETEFGKTAGLLKELEEEGEFRRNIREFGNYLLKIILIIVAIIFFVNAFMEKGMLDSFLFAVALSVGIVPESLPIVITISLSRGALRLAKKKVVVKKLSVIEDMGNIDILCTDKTGTLTENKIVLEKFIDIEGKQNDTLLNYGLLCNSAFDDNGNIRGNPIDVAILNYAKKNKKMKEIKSYEVLSLIEFDYSRKRMSAVVKKDKKRILITKGAFDHVLNVSKDVMINGRKEPIQKHKEFISKMTKALANSGLRIIGVAIKEVKEKEKYTKEDEADLTFLGFMLFSDPPKKDAKDSLIHAEKLGINIKIITGDDPIVTLHIARSLGLKLSEDDVITGSQIEKLNAVQMMEIAKKKTIFARVTPEQKYSIVRSLKSEGHVVAFLGDGINDAPALKAADIGIAVDTGAEVAKDSADIVLLEKKLDVILEGVREGRKTYSNIVKYIINTISANFGNMGTLGLVSPFLKFLPLLPRQILLTNFLTDTPMMAISTDNVEEDELKRPRHWDIKHISRLSTILGAISTIFDLMTIAILIYILNADVALFRTGWFLESALSEIMIVFAIRSRKPVFKNKKPSKILAIISALTVIAIIGIIYSPMGKFFQFIPLPLWLFGAIGIILLTYFIMVEYVKSIYYKHIFKNNQNGL